MFSDVLQTAAAAAVFYAVTDIRDRDVTSLGSRHIQREIAGFTEKAKRNTIIYNRNRQVIAHCRTDSVGAQSQRPL